MVILASLCGLANSSLADSQLFFDSSGDEQAAFGPNAIITVSGNLTFLNRCSRGISDSISGTTADVYVLRHNDLSDHLRDVRGFPSIIRSSLFGNAFWEQELATTKPTGILPSGDYDVVIDECQDGVWNFDTDLRLGGFGDPAAFTVFVPEVVSDLAASLDILNMKADARDQEVVWNDIVKRETLAFLAADVAYIGQATIAKFLGPKAGGLAVFGFLLSVQIDEVIDSVDMVKKYARIAADPPDPNFQQLSRLVSATPLVAADPNPVLRSAVAQVNAMQQQGFLLDALLAAFERYQGAQTAGDGYWALAHAREIQGFGRLLADQTRRTADASSAFRGVVAANSGPLDQGIGSLRAFQARIRDVGFSASEERQLLGFGLSDSGIAALRAQVPQADYTPSVSDLLASLDSLRSSASNTAAVFQQVAQAMVGVVSNLTARDTLDQSQPVALLAGPIVGNVGTPIVFDARASSDPHGTALSYAWDLNGDGLFDDATGAVATVSFPAAFAGHVAVRVTNGEGKEAIAYAYLQVSDPDRAPVFGLLSPSTNLQSLAPGGTLSFQATASDPDGDPVTLRWLLDGQPVGTGASFVYVPQDAAVGLHVLEAQASDGHALIGLATHDWVVTVVRPVALSDLSLAVQTDSDPAWAGTPLVYTLRVVNQGPDSASAVVLTNVLDPGLFFVSATVSQGAFSHDAGAVTANFGPLAAHASATLTITATPGSSGVLSNFAEVGSAAVELNPDDNTQVLATRVNVANTNHADLWVSQLASPAANGTVGAVIYHNLTVSNAGPDTATGVVLTYTIPAGLPFTASAVPAVSTNGADLVFNLPDLPPGQIGQLLLAFTPNFPGNFTNAVAVSANENDPLPANNRIEVGTRVFAPTAQFTDLGLTQSASPTVVSNPLTITLILTNAGPDALSGATLVDTLPAGLLYLSAIPEPAAVGGGIVTFSIGSVGAGQSGIATVQVLPVSAGTFLNTASVVSYNTDTNALNNVSYLDIPVEAVPRTHADLALSIAPVSNPVPVGTNVTLVLTLTNTGPDSASNVVFTAQLPSGLDLVSSSSSLGPVSQQGAMVTVAAGKLAAGAAGTVSFTVKPTQSRPLVTVATVTSPTSDPQPANNATSVLVLGLDSSATVGIVQNFADPEITQLQGYLTEMGLASQVLNRAGLTLDQLQGLRLVIYDDLSYAANGLDGGNVDVFSQASAAGIRSYWIGDDLALSATYGMVEPERSVWIGLLHLQATTDNGPAGFDMEIINPAHPVVDGPFGQVANSGYRGDTDGTKATGTGEVLLGRTGAGADVLLAYKDPGTKNKTVTQNELPYDYCDPEPILQRKKLFQNAVAWLLTDDPSADLRVSQSGFPATVAFADEPVITVTVTNAGPDPASGVLLTDLAACPVLVATASQGTVVVSNGTAVASFGALAAGASATLRLHLRVGDGPSFTNIALVAAATDDPAPADNSSTNGTALGSSGSGSAAPADLALFQVGPTTAGVVQPLVYTLGVTNAGPSAATNVALHDVLPPGLVFLSSESSQGSVISGSGFVDASLGSLAPGASATVSVVLRADAPGVFTNSAVVSSHQADPNGSDNAGFVVTTVSPATASPALLLDIRPPLASFPVGSNLTYQCFVANLGPGPANGVRFTLPLPAEHES